METSYWAENIEKFIVNLYWTRADNVGNLCLNRGFESNNFFQMNMNI